MKSRPRSVERNVAAYLTQLLSDNGKITSPLHRIPVLGREGPDISYDKKEHPHLRRRHPHGHGDRFFVVVKESFDRLG